MLAAVDMTAKPGTLFMQLAVGGKRENLKTSRICKDRSVPAVESVKPSRLFQYVKSWSDI